ncbi:MAG: hypothetical protein Q8P67_05690 [archaeon]|nr:hypothetical protein [archaeon]
MSLWGTVGHHVCKQDAANKRVGIIPQKEEEEKRRKKEQQTITDREEIRIKKEDKI